MNKRERERARRLADKHNSDLRAQHDQLRAQILALRPTWSRAALETITCTYGMADLYGGQPGLSDILHVVQKADALARRFGGPPCECGSTALQFVDDVTPNCVGCGAARPDRSAP